MAAHYYTFAASNNEIYTSPNSQYPPTSIPVLTEYITLSQVRSVQWCENFQPYLTFVPAELDFSGPILGRLSYSYPTLPIVPVNDKWALKHSVMISWHRLERALYGVSQALCRDDYLCIYRYPGSYKYLEMHSTEEAARRHAMMSRDAFVPLMALCSWCMARQMTPNENYIGCRPTWLKKIVDDHPMKVHPGWAEDLRTSCIGNFTIRRVGCFINPYTWIRSNIIEMFFRFNVPVWIWWGTVPRPPRNTKAEKWCPSKEAAVKAIADF
jgi:hypothetical protein